MPFDSTPTPTVTAGDILDRAIELIERKGWCQNEGRNRLGERCIVGAVMDSLVELKGSPALADEIYRGFQLPLGIFEVTAWNDAPDRTMDQVLAKLREVRESLDAV